MKVRKAVIPAAGFGTRMLPITSIVPKELLPVCGRPVIEHVVHEAAEAGIEEVILVISKGKEAVADYFRPNKDLEAILLESGKHDELRMLETIWNMVTITTVYQDEQKGLGHAVLCAAEAVGNEPFAVLLGDSIIQTDECDSFTANLIQAFNRYNLSVVGIQMVDSSLTHQYGIFEGSEIENGFLKGNKLIEKPLNGETISNWAFCARYIFKPEIFEVLKTTLPGKNSEIQLTDAMQQLLKNDGIIGAKLSGERYDIGDPKGLLLANLSLTELGCG